MRDVGLNGAKLNFNYQIRSAPVRLWTLWFAVAAFGLVIALLWLTAYRNATAEVIQAANSESQNANRTFADHSARVMRQVDAVIRGVRSTYLRTGSVGATEQFIADLNIDPSFIENVYLIDAQGQIVIPAKDRARNLSAVGRDYFTFHSKTTKDTPFLTTGVDPVQWTVTGLIVKPFRGLSRHTHRHFGQHQTGPACSFQSSGVRGSPSRCGGVGGCTSLQSR